LEPAENRGEIREKNKGPRPKSVKKKGSGLLWTPGGPGGNVNIRGVKLQQYKGQAPWGFHQDGPAKGNNKRPKKREGTQAHPDRPKNIQIT